jgi:NTE family protein
MVAYRIAGAVKRPVGYVLAGGASYGSVQVGMLRALADSDLRPDLVVGTSVGSLNGAALAENPEEAPERLTNLWANVTREDIFGGVLKSAVALAAGKSTVVSNEGLQNFLEQAVSARDFSQLRVPHTAMTTDFDTAESVPISEGELIPALLASAAIPGVFPEVERNGRRLVDGGLVENVPISEAVAQGAKTIVVLDCGFSVLAPEKDDSFVSRMTRTIAIMTSAQVRWGLEAAGEHTVIYMPGPWPVGIRPDSFAKSAELIMKTEQICREWLAELTIEGPGQYGSIPLDLTLETANAVKAEKDAEAAVAEAAKEAEKAAKEAEKAEKEAAKEAEKAEKEAAKEAEKAEKEAAKEAAEAAGSDGSEESGGYKPGSIVAGAGKTIVGAAKSVASGATGANAAEPESAESAEQGKSAADGATATEAADGVPADGDSADEEIPEARKPVDTVVDAGKAVVEKAKSVAATTAGDGSGSSAADVESEEG